MNNILPREVKETITTRQREKANLDSDRDGHGRQEASDQNQAERQLTDKDVEGIIQYLKNLPGVKENHLQVRLDQKNSTCVVYIEDLQGNVIRRIPRSELALLKVDQSRKTGKILDRAM